MKLIQIPKVIEAVQVTDPMTSGLSEPAPDWLPVEALRPHLASGTLAVQTKRGWIRARTGDWITWEDGGIELHVQEGIWNRYRPENYSPPEHDAAELSDELVQVEFCEGGSVLLQRPDGVIVEVIDAMAAQIAEALGLPGYLLGEDVTPEMFGAKPDAPTESDALARMDDDGARA